MYLHQNTGVSNHNYSHPTIQIFKHTTKLQTSNLKEYKHSYRFANESYSAKFYEAYFHLNNLIP